MLRVIRGVAIRAGIVAAVLILTAPQVVFADTVTSTIPVGTGPYAEVLNADNSRLYVGSAIGADTGSVSVVDTSTNAMLTKFYTGSSRVMDMALSSDGARLYTGHFNGQLKIISTATNTVSLSVATGSSVYGLALSPDGSRIYASDFAANVIRVLNATNLSPITTITGGTHPRLITIAPTGNRAYVAIQGSTLTSQGNVKVIDTVSNTVLATIPTGLGTGAVTLSPDGKSIYASNYGSNDVTVIDTATNTVSATIPVGTQPYQIAFTPDGSRAYVANMLDNTVSIINVAARTVAATIAVGPQPAPVRISSDGQIAYVGNENSNTVSVISLDTFPAIVTTALANGGVGSGYMGSIATSGRPQPTTTVTSGTLPPGLTLNSDGSITGTPLEAGTFTFTVTAASIVSGIPATAQKSFTLTIAPSPTVNGQGSDTLPKTGDDISPFMRLAIVSLFLGGSLFLMCRTLVRFSH
ncbi:MAG TPA: YncE family protein [Candidatus Saccharimonadales bacterium]|nr:YncE family protein [Candidatus Saccharimonadales bacterium]